MRARVGGFVAGAIGAALLVAPEAFGLERRFPWPILVAARPVLAAALAGPAALAVVSRRRCGVRAAAAGVLAVAVPVLARPRRASIEDGPVEFSVLVANLWEGRADPRGLAAILRRERPDVVVLPEAGERFLARLTPGLDGLAYRSACAPPPRPHRFVSDDPDGPWTTVLVADRLGDVAVRPLDLGALWGWLEVSGGALGDVRLLAAHPAAPVPGLTAHWVHELGLLADWCAAAWSAGAATVVAGDLNATAEHRLLHPLGDGTPIPRGPATWPARRRFGFRIDHVLAAGGIGVRELCVLDVPGSDHRAVLARLGRARREARAVTASPPR